MNEKHEAWPPNFDEAKRESVLTRVMGYYADRDVTTAVQDDLVSFPGMPGRDSMGLWIVAAQCASAPIELWSTIIEVHLNDLELAWSNEAQLKYFLSDYDTLADSLTIQVRTDDQASAIPDPVSRIDLAGMRTLLTIDLPNSIHALTRDEVSRWGRSEEELFATGLANLERRLTPVEREMDFGLSSTVRILMEEPPMDPYVASCALWLDRVTDNAGAHGSLVAITNRDMVITYPINNADVTQAIHGMVPLIRKAVAERPHAISNNVYWRRPDGTFEWIPTPVVNGEIQVQLPDDFARLLHYLAGE